MLKNKYIKKTYISQDQEIENIKILPYSLEAEQSVLGALMLDNTQWEYISEQIISNDFHNYAHRVIFSEMQHLLEINKPIDLITLSESLENQGKLELVGGFGYLAELSKNVPSISNVTAYANIIHERSIIRSMITAANEIAAAGYDTQGRNSEELLDFAESLIFKIAHNNNHHHNKPKSIDHVLSDTITQIEQSSKNLKHGITGISSGYSDLDKKTDGLHQSDLIIIAARPSMGKTAFAMNLCEHVAITELKPVLIFSLEMTEDQIVIRMLASLSKVNQIHIRTGQLNNTEQEKVANTIELLLEKRNIYIDDSSYLTPSDIRGRARRLCREHNGLSLIMIDYLQLIKIPTLSNNRTLEISEISRSLKSLAKELKVPIIAISQLNRSLEQRTDKHPVNSDLRESGAIEQDADLILFIYRDEIYHENSDMKGIAEIILGKQRNGPIGTIRLTFNGQWARFDNYIDSNRY